MQNFSGNVTALGITTLIFSEMPPDSYKWYVIIPVLVVTFITLPVFAFITDNIETNLRRRWRNFRFKIKKNDLGFNKRSV